jgi:hypothetical protein
VGLLVLSDLLKATANPLRMTSCLKIVRLVRGYYVLVKRVLEVFEIEGEVEDIGS